jgi:hypothetical protein
LPQARQIERRAGAGIDQLRQGVEEAARSVLGDEAESLRLARQQLDELIKQANGDQTARAGQGQRQPGDANQPMDEAERQRQANAQPGSRGQQPQEGEQRAQAGTERSQDGAAANPQSEMLSPPAPTAGRNPQSDRSGQGQRGQANAGDRQADRRGRGGTPSNRGQEPAPAQAGDARDTNTSDGRGGTGPRGPFADETYRGWSDRLRDVEDMLPQRDLREDLARVWDNVRTLRAESKRHGKEPQWDLVQTQVIKPLTELRERVSEKLAQLESKETMVPIDRDPVPERFTELVKTYFENLGQGAR